MSRDELRAAGDERVAAARRVEGTVERRLHRGVVELSEPRVDDGVTGGRSDGRIETALTLTTRR
jgi:hypothetical protein